MTTVQEYWENFLSLDASVPKDVPYQVWHFGNTAEMAVELGELVLSGKKVATASLAAVNQMKPDEAPVPNGYSIVTDVPGRPMCIIKTVEILHVPFDEVSPEFAADEGEGDRSLTYWRQVHERYFSREAAESGVGFDHRSIVCCERFKLLFP